jgi:hypothetical protein
MSGKRSKQLMRTHGAIGHNISLSHYLNSLTGRCRGFLAILHCHKKGSLPLIGERAAIEKMVISGIFLKEGDLKSNFVTYL